MQHQIINTYNVLKNLKYTKNNKNATKIKMHYLNIMYKISATFLFNDKVLNKVNIHNCDMVFKLLNMQLTNA